MLKRRFIPIAILLSGAIVTVPLVLTSCSRSGITVANFESYMSTDVIHNLKHDHDIKNSLNFSYYATNEDIETKFKRYYDIAIPSSYEVITLLMKNQLEKIDWQQFNLKQIDQGVVMPTENITNGAEAISLFSIPAQNILNQATAYIQDENNWPTHHFPDWFDPNSTILDYGVPYFLQDWIFTYKWNTILGLNDYSSYNDILQCASPSGNNFQQFFRPNGTEKIGMIDDSRSVYDFCKAIATEQSGSTTIDITNEKTIDDFQNTYSSLTTKYNNGYFWLSSDSGQMNISLANPLRSGGLNSAFTYNGDILYAAMGSDWNAGKDDTDPTYIQYFDDDDDNHLQMHIVRPPSVPAMMDMMVINKKSAETNKRDDLYKIVYKICLDSANLNPTLHPATDDINNTYSFQNFEFVLYTDPLFFADEYIKDSYFTEDNFDNYSLLKKIYDMDSTPLVEKPIIDVLKANMYQAYIVKKEQL